MAHCPALLRTEPAAAAALTAGIANHQVAVLAQILQRQLAPEPVQRMLGMRRGDEAQPHQRIAGEARRHLRANRQINLTLQQRLLGAAEHALVQLDARLRPLLGEAREALQQQPGGKDDLHREPQLRFPARGQAAGSTFQCAGFLEQRLGAPVQHLAGRREMRLAADHLEYLHAEQRFDLLHGIGHRRLALVQHLGGLGIAAGIDHGQQRTPLLQGNPGIADHISNE